MCVCVSETQQEDIHNEQRQVMCVAFGEEPASRLSVKKLLKEKQKLWNHSHRNFL